MMSITQGDQYSIPIIIKQGDTVITNENVQGVRIAIENAVFTYPGGHLEYSDGVWYFPLTQELSYLLEEGKAKGQVQIRIGRNIIGSKTKEIDINECIIKEGWD